MDDQEQELERVSLELSDLRGNVGQIMEMIQALSTKLDTPRAIVILEVSGPIFKP